MKVLKKVARTTLYVTGLRVPNSENKSGFSHFKTRPANDEDKVFAEKGDTYYQWKFPYGATRYSRSYPDKRSLTQNAHVLRIYDLEDMQQGISCETPGALASDRDSLVEEIRSYQEELDEKLNNIPENLQEAPAAEILRERVEALEEWANDLEDIDLDLEESATAEELSDKYEEISTVSHNC